MNKICGIYEIKNKLNNDRYVGSSFNVSERTRKHRECLRTNRHRNPHLQSAWNKYGEDNFEFNILFECDKEHLLIEEQKLLDKLPHYNIAKCALSPHTGLKNSKETRAKISKSNLGRIVTKETRVKIGNGNRGIVRTPEFNAQMSAARKGKRLPEEQKRKISESLFRFRAKQRLLPNG